jgi:hypothetical protein
MQQSRRTGRFSAALGGALLALGVVVGPVYPLQDPSAGADIGPIGPLTDSTEAVRRKAHQDSDARQKAADQDLPVLRARLNAAVEELKRDRRYTYLEIEDILVDPAGHAGRDISVLGLPEYNSHQGYFDLVGSRSAVPIDISGLEAQERAEVDATIVMADHDFIAHAHAAIVKGRLVGGPQKGYTLAASAVSLFPIPSSIDTLKLPALLSDAAKNAHSDVLTLRERLLAAIQGLRQDQKHRYVEVEDLLLSREKYSGQDISTIGLTSWEEGYFRSPYFDLTASFYESKNRIPVLMTPLPLASRKELLRNEDLPHLVVIKGRITETADGKNYYLTPSEYSDLGETLDSPAHILDPDVPTLAPFSGDVKGFRKNVARGLAVPESEQRVQLDEFRDKLLAAIAALRKDRRFAYAEIEDIGLEPDAYLERDLVTIGVPRSVDAVSAMPHFEIANSPQEPRLSIPVLMSRFSADLRKEIIRVGGGENILVVRGKLKKSSDEKYYIDASGYSDLGRSQKDANSTYMPVSCLLQGSSAFGRHREDPEKKQRLQAAIADLKKDDGWRYADFKALHSRPADFAGADLATIGLPFSGAVQHGGAYFSLYESDESDDSIPVVISGLARQAQKRIFQIMGEDALVVKGRLQRNNAGEYYIEASGYSDLGPMPITGWGVPGFVVMPRIRW